MKPTNLLILALLLTACTAVTPSPAPTATPPPSPTPPPTATLTPTPVPTATPTPIPTLPPGQVGGLEGVPDPRAAAPELFDLTRPDAPIPQFVNAMRMGGIEVDTEEVANNLQYRIITGADRKPYVIGTYHLDPDPNKKGETLEGPIPLMIWSEGEGWRNIFPIDLESQLPTLFGVSLPMYDYRNPFLKNFAEVIWSEPFNRNWVEKKGSSMANKLVDLVAKSNAVLYMHPGLWHLDVDSKLKSLTTRDQVLDYINNLAEYYMNYAFNAHQRTGKPVFINFVNEPWWADPPNYPVNTGWLESPYYRYLGRNYIIEAYMAFYNAGVNKGLVPGQDFRLIVSVDGIFFPNIKLNLTINEIKRAKMEIARRLGTSQEQVQLDVAVQFRFDKNVTGPKTSDKGRYRIPSNEEVVTALETLRRNNIPFHITEYEIANVSTEEFYRYLNEFTKIAVEKGALSINFGGIADTGRNPERIAAHPLYNVDNGYPTENYYIFQQLLWSILNK